MKFIQPSFSVTHGGNSSTELLPILSHVTKAVDWDSLRRKKLDTRLVGKNLFSPLNLLLLVVWKHFIFSQWYLMTTDATNCCCLQVSFHSFLIYVPVLCCWHLVFISCVSALPEHEPQRITVFDKYCYHITGSPLPHPFPPSTILTLPSANSCSSILSLKN